MKDLNKEEIKEIEIKQNRLKTVLNIEKLVSSSADDVDVDKDDISDYCVAVKNDIVFDILAALNIDDFDESFTDSDGSVIRCTVEDAINSIVKYHGDIYSVEKSIYSEFVSVLATYDIVDLLNYSIIHQYLKMFNVVTLAYDEISLESCKTI